MLDIVQPQREFTSARSFLEALLPINWPAALSQTWLFRGQSADYPLVPSLFRDDCKKIRSLVEKEISLDYNINLAERDVLTRFFEIADQRGLILPDDSQQLRVDIETFKSVDGESNVAHGFRGWNMSDRVLSLMALAQHYGVPTRLLDWSRLPLAAAYFAAEGGAKRLRTDPNSQHKIIVVWALFFPPCRQTWRDFAFQFAAFGCDRPQRDQSKPQSPTGRFHADAAQLFAPRHSGESERP